MGLKALQCIRDLRIDKVDQKCECEELKSCSSWPEADELWERAKDSYAMIAVRNSRLLDVLYPACNERFRRLKVQRDGRVLGWAVVLNSKLNDKQYFGDLRVGSVIDCLAVPEEEYHVVNAATGYLESQGVDLIVTHQLHLGWCKSFARNGYLRGPSNFIFAASPSLAEKLRPFETQRLRVHMTRGDGDGPFQL